MSYQYASSHPSPSYEDPLPDLYPGFAMGSDENNLPQPSSSAYRDVKVEDYMDLIDDFDVSSSTRPDKVDMTYGSWPACGSLDFNFEDLFKDLPAVGTEVGRENGSGQDPAFQDPDFCVDGYLDILETPCGNPYSPEFSSSSPEAFFPDLEEFDKSSSSPPASTSAESPKSRRRSPKATATAGPFHCTHAGCNQSFKRANALQRHIHSLHDKSGEYCPFCPPRKRCFNRSDNFQRHVSTRHKEVNLEDERLHKVLRNLYQGTGRRTCWTM